MRQPAFRSRLASEFRHQRVSFRSPDVAGKIKITDGSQANGYVLTSAGDGLATWKPAGGPAADSGWTHEGAVVRLTTSSDKVGIGTTAPIGGLHVANSRGSNPLALEGTWPAVYYWDNEAGDVSFMTYVDVNRYRLAVHPDTSEGNPTYGLTDLLTVTSDGKVGIGTTGPQAPLHHTGRATAGGFSDVTRVSDSGGGAGANREIYSVGGSPLSAVETLPSGNMNFYSGGNVGSPTLALNADGTVEAKRGDYRFQGPPVGVLRQFLALRTYITNSPKTVLVPAETGFRVSSPDNSAPIFDLTQHGVLWVLGGYSSGSDERMKFYPTNLDYGVSTVKLLQPKRYFRANFTYNAETGDIVFDPDSVTNDIGLVAQDVYPLIPEAVYKPQDENKEIWSLEYDKFIPVLVKAIQEQQTEIENLQPAAIEALQKTVQDQRQQIEEQQQQIETQQQQIDSLQQEGDAQRQKNDSQQQEIESLKNQAGTQQQTIIDLLKRVEALENK